jgi:hypothetical protein
MGLYEYMTTYLSTCSVLDCLRPSQPSFCGDGIRRLLFVFLPIEIFFSELLAGQGIRLLHSSWADSVLQIAIAVHDRT